jgi:RNA polymerase sigma factor (sigma-70 family)
METTFDYALDSHSKPLMGFALKLTKDYNDASDLLQDTMMKAFSNQHRFQEGTNLSAWLHTIMRNSFISNYQRMVRQKTFIDKTDNTYFINSQSTSKADDATVDLNYKELLNEIKRLDDLYSEPFLMYYEGFKYHEIADRMGVPIGTIKNRIHVARQKIKSFVKR